jgi:hypothetical protein
MGLKAVMALRRISDLGLALALVAFSAATAVTVLSGRAVPATAGPVSTATPTTGRPAMSAELLPACGPGAMVNIAQAALGRPRQVGAASPAAAITEYARVVGVALPAGAVQRTLSLSDSDALVQGAGVVGHAVRHGDHWQGDYLAVCFSTKPLPAPPAVPSDQGPSLPDPTGLVNQP